MVRQMILAGLVVILPVGVQAQRHGAMSPAFHPVAVGPRVAVARAPHVVTAQALPGTRTLTRVGVVRARPAAPIRRNMRREFSTRRRFDRFDNNDFGRLRPECNSAPGLGFDAAHLAAICGSTTFGSRTNGFGSSLFFPFFDGGFSIPSSPAAVAEGSTVDAQQAEETDAEPVERNRRSRVTQPVTAPVAETASSAPSESEEYVFVRRDGTVFFAVAYAWENRTLRYINTQGLRRMVTQDELDLDATRQFNEQRGLNFHSPA